MPCRERGAWLQDASNHLWRPKPVVILVGDGCHCLRLACERTHLEVRLRPAAAIGHNGRAFPRTGRRIAIRSRDGVLLCDWVVVPVASFDEVVLAGRGLVLVGGALRATGSSEARAVLDPIVVVLADDARVVEDDLLHHRRRRLRRGWLAGSTAVCVGILR